MRKFSRQSSLLETETRPETSETETQKNRYRGVSRDQDQVAWLNTAFCKGPG